MMRLIRRGGLLSIVVVGLALTACAQTRVVVPPAEQAAAPAVERGEIGAYKIGRPYEVDGVWYYPKADYGYRETGIASWYGPGFHGMRTANGETYDQNALTAAHRTLPLPSMVRVTNLDNGRSIKVRINDRGPFSNGRIIDLSRRAADLLGFRRNGTAKVLVEILETESRRLAIIALGKEAARTAPEPAPTVPVTVAPLSSSAGGPAPARPPSSLAPARPPSSLTAGQSAALSEPAAAAPGPRPIGPAAKPLRPRLAAPVVDGVVTQMPVRPSSIFVQAGSFIKIHNATQLRARLAQLGNARIAQAVVDNRRFYRVRFGPLGSVEEADNLLEILLEIGHTDARVVVD
ncbi:MAG: septal ring lytic transglycosylase RlpA family protein [Kiloniellaceae bacterium]